MINLQTVKSLGLTFAPFLISYALSYYRDIRSQVRANKPAVRAAPYHIVVVSNVLLSAAIAAIILSLPYFGPENIIKATNSRVSTSTALLFQRVAELRPNGALTELDQRLSEKLRSIDTRCLYLLWGPDVMVNCPFCNPDNPKTYFIYALPSILLPHLLNIGLLGLVTSVAIAGREGNRWRTQAALGGFIMAICEIFAFYNVPWHENANTFYSKDLVFWYSWIRMVRYIAIAVFDAGFAGVLWAASSNRLFVVPYTASERVDAVGRAMENTSRTLNIAGIVSNSAARDQELRRKSELYWQREEEVMREVMTSEEVSRAVSNVLGSGKLNMDQMDLDAKNFSERLFSVQEQPR
jgi:hypothetical protein